MKLYEIVDLQPTEPHSRISEEQFQIIFNAVKDEELSVKEIKEIAAELAQTEAFGRNFGSAVFALIRMHILVHGSAPHGITEHSAENFFNHSGPMIDFVERLGIDTGERIRRARIDLKNRPVAVKQADATRMMADYYKANKGTLPKTIAQHRVEIIKGIMTGLTPEEAFNRFL